MIKKCAWKCFHGGKEVKCQQSVVVWRELGNRAEIRIETVTEVISVTHISLLVCVCVCATVIFHVLFASRSQAPAVCVCVRVCVFVCVCRGCVNQLKRSTFQA